VSPDAFQALLASLRGHADVCTRWRAVLPGHGAIKGINEADARYLAAQHGGVAERSEVWVLRGGWELLAPWRPAGEGDVSE